MKQITITKYLSSVLFFLVFSSLVYGDVCPANQYKDRLAKLGFDQVSSVEIAANELIKLASDMNDNCKEELLYTFRKYYYKALESYDRKSDVGNWNYPISDSKKLKFNSSISKVGWTLKESEGIYYIGESGEWFQKKFKTIFTESYSKYLSLRLKEIKEGFSEDAGLLISWEQLRKRIVLWEEFLKDHPNFKENPEIRDYLNIYIRTFLTGMDNSRIYDSNTKKLRTEVKAAFEKYIKENKKSAYYTLVKDYYEMLKNNKFIVSEDSNEYLKKKGYETMLGKQPPTY